MKTTVDIPDALAEEARKLASREGTTLKVLIEQGLRKVIAEPASRAKASSPVSPRRNPLLKT